MRGLDTRRRLQAGAGVGSTAADTALDRVARFSETEGYRADSLYASGSCLEDHYAFR